MQSSYFVLLNVFCSISSDLNIQNCLQTHRVSKEGGSWESQAGNSCFRASLRRQQGSASHLWLHSFPPISQPHTYPRKKTWMYDNFREMGVDTWRELCQSFFWRLLPDRKITMSLSNSLLTKTIAPLPLSFQNLWCVFISPACPVVILCSMSCIKLLLFSYSNYKQS